MLLPQGTTIAVADGEKLHLYVNNGEGSTLSLAAIDNPAISGDNKGSGGRHHSSSANPDSSRLEEDSYAAATAQWLNQQVMGGKIGELFIIAAPKTLGELRKHYHKTLEAKLLGELPKDLTDHSIKDIEAALTKA